MGVVGEGGVGGEVDENSEGKDYSGDGDENNYYYR